jgi:hypothetical protein
MLYLVDVTGTLPSVSPLHHHHITIINNTINYNIITFMFFSFSFLAIQGNGKGYTRGILLPIDPNSNRRKNKGGVRNACSFQVKG